MDSRHARRGVYRGMYSALHREPDFLALPKDARHMIYALRLADELGIAGIGLLYPEQLARYTGMTEKEVETAIQVLEQRQSGSQPWVYREGALIWLRNGLRHDPTVSLANSNQLWAVVRWLDGLPHSPLVTRFRRYYQIAKAITRAKDRAREGLSPPMTHDPGLSTQNPGPNSDAGARKPDLANASGSEPKRQPTAAEQLAALAQRNGLTPEELHAQADELARKQHGRTR